MKGSEEALVRQLEQELKTAKEELHSTIEEMEAANEELKSANEEIMSMNEELQAANEELETSKEELQSLNEELATVNSQLQNKLEELETVNNDLNNLLSNTDIATLFLDRHLCIKRFTPATRRLFNLISTDLGRPLNDISHKFQDGELFHEAEKVLDKLFSSEREVQTVDKRWYLQRLRPYQTQDKRIDGVVVTFIDITERKQAEETSLAAKTAAEHANAQKSQFLAATSHDLRQPLQALTLLNATLLQQVREQQPLALLNRQSETLHGMSELLNALLDISQLDAGKLTPTFSVFPVHALFHPLQEEFSFQAQEKGLEFRIRACPLHIHSDHALLERILSNFLTNALRYTKDGKILLAARRRGTKLHLGVWDTGCGFPQAQLKHIFNEFYQLKNAARERSKGVGLGLAIAHRLARLLNHRLLVRSTEGKGSMFAVEVPIARESGFPAEPQNPTNGAEPRPAEPFPPVQGQGTIFLVEDDPAVAESLAIYLQVAGFQLLQANHGEEALAHIRDRAAMPDAVISDYRLPGEINGLEVIRAIRQLLAREIPAILLTGDTPTLQPEEITAQHCHLLHKPIAGKQLVEFLNRLMS